MGKQVKLQKTRKMRSFLVKQQTLFLHRFHLFAVTGTCQWSCGKKKSRTRKKRGAPVHPIAATIPVLPMLSGRRICRNEEQTNWPG
jgi:hypothetical protein